MIDVDHGVFVDLRVGLGFVEDGVYAGPCRRSPSGEHTRALEGIARQRAEPDHPMSSSSSSSPIVSALVIGHGGRPACSAACLKAAIATSTASSLAAASTTSCAP